MVYSSAAESVRLDKVFHALADPTRRSILRAVSEKAKVVGEVAEPFNMSLAAVSKHLKVLENADLITREKQGSFQFVRTKPKPMKRAQEWLCHFERFWNEHLDDFEAEFGTRRRSK